MGVGEPRSGVHHTRKRRNADCWDLPLLFGGCWCDWPMLFRYLRTRSGQHLVIVKVTNNSCGCMHISALVGLNACARARASACSVRMPYSVPLISRPSTALRSPRPSATMAGSPAMPIVLQTSYSRRASLDSSHLSDSLADNSGLLLRDVQYACSSGKADVVHHCALWWGRKMFVLPGNDGFRPGCSCCVSVDPR